VPASTSQCCKPRCWAVTPLFATLSEKESKERHSRPNRRCTGQLLAKNAENHGQSESSPRCSCGPRDSLYFKVSGCIAVVLRAARG
jgi:hypothetical protein